MHHDVTRTLFAKTNPQSDESNGENKMMLRNNNIATKNVTRKLI